MNLRVAFIMMLVAMAAAQHTTPRLPRVRTERDLRVRNKHQVDKNEGGRQRYWVHYKRGRHDACVQTVQGIQKQGGKKRGIKLNYDFPKANSVVVTATKDQVTALKADPNVERIVLDPVRFSHHNLRRSRDLLRWEGQAMPYGIELVQADKAWEEGVTGQGITVCVIDTGLDMTHEDFNTADITGDSLASDSTPWSVDRDGHGTHVAGTIAAANNDLGLVGVAPDSNLHVVKVFDDNGYFVYSSAVVDAAYRCRDAGAKIISMSLGGATPVDEEKEIFNQLFYDDGILSVASAGNDGTSAHSYPASYDNVISVGAVNRLKNRTSFSQFNDRVDLVAPGLDVWSTVPMLMDNCQICQDMVMCGYLHLDGTSMSAPHVSGVAALLWSSNSTAPVNHIRNALLASAEDLGATSRDLYYGQGLVQASKALRTLDATLSGEEDLIDWRPVDETVFCQSDEMLVEVNLKTDRYGNETFWEIVREADDFTVMAGALLGNYQTYQTLGCLPKNCYTFTVYDSFGDGMCCGFGNGGINVTVEGERLLSATNFTDSESVSFGGDCLIISDDPKPECDEVTLKLLTDRYPGETSVVLEEVGGTTKYWADEEFSEQETEYTLTECIDPTVCYHFQIFDNAGDGLCCSYGEGWFQLYYNDNLVHSGGNFTSSDSYFFGEGCS